MEKVIIIAEAGVNHNGNVKVGDSVFYGSGAVSKQGIIIPDNSFIKANSIVI